MFIFEFEGSAIGQVRLERQDSHYVIHYSLSNLYRGFKLGYLILKIAIENVNQSESNKYIANVKKGNVASIKIFEKMGFRKVNMQNSDVFSFELDNKH
jgi:RimJ/RimL family protein N-acetyltransferase